VGLQAGGGTSYAARMSGAGGRAFAVTPGVGLDARVAKGSAVVVRTLDLPLAKDWSLSISAAGGGGAAQGTAAV
jgi:hypothetical protein